MKNQSIIPQKFGSTGLSFDIHRLRNEFQNIVKSVPFDELTNQISISTRPGNEENPYDGVGSLYDYEKKQFWASEDQFSEVANAFKNTYIEEVIKKANSAFEFNFGRARLMRLNPKNCLSLHNDFDIRFHIPLVTNPQCYFAFEDGPIFHIPADGQLYWTNTLLKHTVLNGNNEQERVHLVLSTHEKDRHKVLSFMNANSKSKNPLKALIHKIQIWLRKVFY